MLSNSDCFCSACPPPILTVAFTPARSVTRHIGPGDRDHPSSQCQMRLPYCNENSIEWVDQANVA
jgi:hypothetical protein